MYVTLRLITTSFQSGVTSTGNQCTGWPKNWHHFVRLNFTKYWPIFTIISLSESGENQ